MKPARRESLRRLLPFLALGVFAAVLLIRSDWFLGNIDAPSWWEVPWAEHDSLYGQSLAYGTPMGNISWEMPLNAAFTEWVRVSPIRIGQVLVVAVWLAPTLLAFSLAAELAGWEAGCLAAAMAVSFDPRDPLYPNFPGQGVLFETALYACLLTCLAAALSRRAKASSPASNALLGLTIGLSLLCRSPMFLFPAVLISYDYVIGGTKPSLAALGRWLPLIAVPSLMLLPWAYMNERIFGRWIVFENGRAVCNLLTGAAGYVKTLQEGSYLKALSLSSEPAHPFLSALQMILRRPFTYAGAVVVRILYALSMHPFLFLLSAAALWTRRATEQARQLGLLLAYFIAVHCLMPIEPRYIQPLWPLLCALSAVPLARSLFTDSVATGGTLNGFLALQLIPLTALAAWTLLLVASYPRRLEAFRRDPNVITASRPKDPWPWMMQGLRLENQGDACGASRNYEQALRLAPTSGILSDYRRTQRKLLDNQLVLMQPLSAGANRSGSLYLVDHNALQALEYLKQGNRAAAKEPVRALKQEWFEPPCKPHKVIYEAVPSDMLKTLIQGPPLHELSLLISDWPGKERSRFLKSFSRYEPHGA